MHRNKATSRRKIEQLVTQCEILRKLDETYIVRKVSQNGNDLELRNPKELLLVLAVWVKSKAVDCQSEIAMQG